jgi:hypothetical protein
MISSLSSSQRPGRQARQSSPQYEESVCRAAQLRMTWVFGGMVYSFPRILSRWKDPAVYLGMKNTGP